MPQPTHDSQAFVHLLRQFVRLCEALQQTPNDPAILHQREVITHELQASLHVPLRKFAVKWIRTGGVHRTVEPTSASDMDVIQKIAVDAFGTFIIFLLQVRSQNEELWQKIAANPIPFVIQTVRWRMIDEYRHAYRTEVYERRSSATATVDESEPTPLFHSIPLSTLTIDPIDQLAYSEDQLVERLDDRNRLQQLLAYWQQTLSAVDLQIVTDRLIHELSYEMIAHQLGAGWTVATIRKRYSRILERTRNQFLVRKEYED